MTRLVETKHFTIKADVNETPVPIASAYRRQRFLIESNGVPCMSKNYAKVVPCALKNVANES